MATQPEVSPAESDSSSGDGRVRRYDAGKKQAGEKVIPSKHFRWVRLAGWLFALVLLIPALPVILLMAMLVQMTSPGPGIYRQRRVGLNGRPFTLYKIRTMMHNAEAETGPVWTAPNDPRVTRLGRLLRPLHLDELPQLFNVLLGHMTLIGPRPERPEFTEYLAREIPRYMDRYRVPPGITGLAQLNLPTDTDVERVRRKLVLDMEYIRGATLWMDVRIVMCTIARLVGFSGMRIARWLKLDREPIVPDNMRRGPSAGSDLGEGIPTTYRPGMSRTAASSGNGDSPAATRAKDTVPTT